MENPIPKSVSGWWKIAATAILGLIVINAIAELTGGNNGLFNRLVYYPVSTVKGLLGKNTPAA